MRHVLPIVDAEDLAEVAIRRARRTGRPLLLGDVADVVVDHQPLIGDAVINDGPGLMLIVEKLPWANTLEVTRGVEAALEELRARLCPGSEIDTTIFRPATFIEQAIDNLIARAACSAACWWSSCSVLLPVRLADGPDQRGRRSRCR